MTREARLMSGIILIAVPTIRSRDVACAEWSNVRRFEHFL